MTGKLELIIGPMFSGKSTELIRRINLLKVINKKVLVVKPSIDIRYNTDKLTTHNYESTDCVVLENLSSINNEINNYDVVVIDEGQFFKDLKKTVSIWVDNYNINVIVGGLDGDYERKPIGQILELIPMAESCVKLCSYCNMCSNGIEGPFSLRLIKSNDQILIGGVETYIPVCRFHYLESNNFNSISNSNSN